MSINWHMDKWYLRVLRRFAVVFISGGILAAIEELRILEIGGSSEQILMISAVIAVLTAIEKAVREPMPI